MRRFLKRLAPLVMILCLSAGWVHDLGATTRDEGSRGLLAQLDQSQVRTGGPVDARVDAERRKARSRFGYLALGYGLVWIALGFSILHLHRRVSRVRSDIDALSHRLAEPEPNE